MTAQIVQNDGGGSVTGSVDNGSLTTVDLSNLSNAGVLGWSWELLYRPQGSSAAIASPNASATSFTPDVNGTYLIRLTTYLDAPRTVADDVDEQCYAIRLGAPYPWRIPAAGETGQFDSAAGWAPAREAAIRDVHAFMTSPGPTYILGDGPHTIDDETFLSTYGHRVHGTTLFILNTEACDITFGPCVNGTWLSINAGASFVVNFLGALPEVGVEEGADREPQANRRGAWVTACWIDVEGAPPLEQQVVLGGELALE